MAETREERRARLRIEAERAGYPEVRGRSSTPVGPGRESWAAHPDHADAFALTVLERALKNRRREKAGTQPGQDPATPKRKACPETR